jgi:hypothetical protein
MAYQSYFTESGINLHSSDDLKAKTSEEKIEKKEDELTESFRKPYVSRFTEDGLPTATISATTGAGIPQNLQPEIPAYHAIGHGKEEETEESKKYKQMLDKSKSHNK